MTPVCVLRSGGDFGPEHVQWLARQVPGIVCLADADVPGVETIALRYDWPKWWAKLEVFGPSIAGDVMFYDLDTVVLRSLPVPDRTTVLTDFGWPSRMASGLMFVTERDRARVWERFIADPNGHMQACRRWPRWGDQGFLHDVIGGSQRWQSFVPGEVVSYKLAVRGKGLPASARVVCFHGKPRPWECGEPWVNL